MCSYGQLSEVQMVFDPDLDLGSGQGHVNIHSTCRTTCTLNYVIVASRITEIWPFEFRQISILDEVWTLVITFLDGNSKIGLQQAVVQVPYYGHQPSVLSSRQNGGEDRPRKVHFSQLRKLRDLDLRSGQPSRSHWCAYVVEVYPHTKLDGNQKTFCGRTDRRIHPSSNLLGHR